MFSLPASMGLTDILSLAIAAILVNNYILVQFLGCCSFFGVSKKDRYCRWYGHGGYLCYGAGVRGFVVCAVFHFESAGSGLHADHCIHSGYRNTRTVC